MATEIVELPSGLTLSLRGMRAREMSLLADTDEDGDEDNPRKKVHRKKKVGKKKNPITNILQGCTTEVLSLGPYESWGAVTGEMPRIENGQHIPGPGKLPFPELLMCDRFVALTRVRAATWGDGYEFRVRCQAKDCDRHRKPFLWEIPLSELEVKPLPEASRQRVAKKELVFEFQMGGKRCKFKLQQGLDEMNTPDLSEMPKGKIFLAQCATRLIYVEGVDVTDFEALLEWVADLELPEVLTASRGYDDVDGGIETNTIVVCPDCGLEFEHSVPFDAASFLQPERRTPAGRQTVAPTS